MLPNAAPPAGEMDGSAAEADEAGMLDTDAVPRGELPVGTPDAPPLDALPEAPAPLLALAPPVEAGAPAEPEALAPPEAAGAPSPPVLGTAAAAFACCIHISVKALGRGSRQVVY